MAADLTVMPLIASSEYREFISFVGTAKLDAHAGDLHPEGLGHAIMALDIKSKLMETVSEWAVTELKRPPDPGAAGWIGGSIDIYLDDDPFWAELAKAKDQDKFMQQRGMQIPVGIHIPVTNAAKLALFLNSVRVYAEQSEPFRVTWENRKHNGLRYVRVAQRGQKARTWTGSRTILDGLLRRDALVGWSFRLMKKW